MRLKEFYQQEFRCVYTEDTKNNYHANIIGDVEIMIRDIVALPTRQIPSDRLPSYSLKTTDIEVDNADKWMEVCSVSTRKDFNEMKNYNGKKLIVLEIAIGLDRIIYNTNIRKKL